MYEMEKDNYETINQTEIEQSAVSDLARNSPQNPKQSHVAKVLPNNIKHQTGMSQTMTELNDCVVFVHNLKFSAFSKNRRFADPPNSEETRNIDAAGRRC